MKTKRFFLFALTFLIVTVTFGQNRPYLVKDINLGSGSSIRFGTTGTGGAGASTMSSLELSRNFCVFKNALYFFASDGTKISLWKSDGTQRGTAIFTTFDYANTVAAGEFGGLVATDNYLYFFANTTLAGTELWRSDGTEKGTVLLKDFNKGAGSGIISSGFQAVEGIGDILYFTARSSGTGTGSGASSSNELWRSDGTELGTTVLRPKIGTNNATAIGALMAFKDKIYFTANSSATGSELWVTDGTDKNTALFKEFGTGSTSGPTFLGQYNLGTIATDKYLYMVDARKLYRSDGTAAGTVLVNEISSTNDIFAASTPPGLPNNFSRVGEIIYFMASNRASFGGTSTAPVGTLWRSDGTDAGTEALTSNAVERPERLFQLKNSFLILGSLYGNQTNQPPQRALWASSVVEPIPSALSRAVGRSIDVGSDNTALNFNNNALFIAQGPRQDFYVWRTDGTAAATDTLASLNPVTATYLCGIVNNQLLYYANSTQPNVGWELFAVPVVITPPNCSIKAAINSQNFKIPCNGGMVSLNAAASGSTGPYLYQWKRGDSTLKANGPTISVTQRGNYSVTIIDGKGCVSASSSVEVTQAFLPTLNVGGTPSLCRNVGTTLSANLTGGKPPFVYQWKLADNDLKQNTLSLAIVQGGRYSVNVTDSEGCLVSAVVNVSEDNVKASIAGDLAFCTGKNTTLNTSVQGGVMPYTYQWKQGTNNVGTNANSLVVSTPGSFSIYVKDARGCEETAAAVAVQELALPPASITASQMQLAAGETSTLSANVGAGLTYQWQQDQKAIANATNATYVANQAGAYRVVVTRTGCVSVSSEITIGVITAVGAVSNEALTLELSPNPVSQVCRVKLVLDKPARASLQLSDARGRVVYEWKQNQPAIVHETTLNVAHLEAGTYFIQATAGEKRLVKKLIKNGE